MRAASVLFVVVLLCAVTLGAGATLPPGGTYVDDDGSPHEAAIEAVTTAGFAGGCSNDGPRFCPTRPVSRAQIAGFVVRALGLQDSLGAPRGLFSDVDGGTWYAPHVELLTDRGVVEGYTDGTYRPDDPVSRLETAAILVRALEGDPDLDPVPSSFVDVASGTWYSRHVERLYQLGVTDGCGMNPQRFCPFDWVTRAEMASLLQRAFDLPLEVVPPREGSFGGDTIWLGSQKSDWKSEANSGEADINDVTTDLLGPALKLSNYDVDGSHKAGARINHQGFDDPMAADPVAHAGDRIQPTEAWYAATYVVPFYIDGQDNVFQFKQGDGTTRRHLWNVGWKPVDGRLRFIVRTRLDGSTWKATPRELAVLGPVPIGNPFRIEVFRRMSSGPDGRYEVRIDGQLVYSFDGPTIATNLEPRPQGNHEWVLSHYLGRWQGSVEPADSWIFVTDAAIRR